MLKNSLLIANNQHISLCVFVSKGDDRDDSKKCKMEAMLWTMLAIYHADEPLKVLSAADRQEKRQTDVREKVEAYFDFVNTFDLENPLASEKLKDAIRYSRNQEECLCRFLCDGNIPLDDGATERNVRPVAQGRRNYLFSNTISGAEATVIASTLLETVKANGRMGITNLQNPVPWKPLPPEA